MRDSSPLNDCSGDLTGGVFVFYKVMNSENVSLFLCSVSVVAVSLTRVANSQPDGALWRAPCSPGELTTDTWRLNSHGLLRKDRGYNKNGILLSMSYTLQGISLSHSC